MPSSSKAQFRLFAAAAHNPAFAAKVGIKQGVAKEWNKADAGDYKSLPDHVGKKQGAALRRSM